MNFGRETLLAGLVGFAAGLLAAWAVWSLPQFLPQKQTPPASVQEVNQSQVFALTLTSPEDETMATEAQTQVNGQTSAGAILVIDGPLEDKVIEASADGSFSATLALEEGTNEIAVTAYAPTGEETTQVRTVIFTKEEF